MKALMKYTCAFKFAIHHGLITVGQVLWWIINYSICYISMKRDKTNWVFWTDIGNVSKYWYDDIIRI